MATPIHLLFFSGCWKVVIANDCDEEVHIIVDQITPYSTSRYAREDGQWEAIISMTTLPSISAKPYHFTNRNHTGGGHALRRAFMSTDPHILEKRVWGLKRIMNVVNGLDASGYIDIVKLLLIQSGNLTVANSKTIFYVQVLRLCHSVTNSDKTN